MRSLITKLRGEDFNAFTLFVQCILDAGQRDSSVQTTIVNSIRGVAEEFDARHNTNFKDRIPRNRYNDPELCDSDEEEDRDSGCASDAPLTPIVLDGREDSLDYSGATTDSDECASRSDESASHTHSDASAHTLHDTLPTLPMSSKDSVVSTENEEESNINGRF